MSPRSRHRFFLLAAASILAFDLVAALISRASGIPYASFSIGSFLIYLAIGFVAQRRFGLRVAALAGGVTGLVESTLGWAISWVIGPGRADMQQPTVVMIGGTIVLVTILGLGVALLGAGIARVIARNVPPAEVRSDDVGS